MNGLGVWPNHWNYERRVLKNEYEYLRSKWKGKMHSGQKGQNGSGGCSPGSMVPWHWVDTVNQLPEAGPTNAPQVGQLLGWTQDPRATLHLGEGGTGVQMSSPVCWTSPPGG